MPEFYPETLVEPLRYGRAPCSRLLQLAHTAVQIPPADPSNGWMRNGGHVSDSARRAKQ